MAIIDVVKWNAPEGVFARKHPSEQLASWTQLIVNETQEAVLVKEGRMLGPFGPGRHTLDTKNIPALERFIGIPFGRQTPFTAEVWFVNRTIQLDTKWGTATPIQVKDPVYNIMLPVSARGQFGLTVRETKKFLKKMVGTKDFYTSDELRSSFRGIVLSAAKTLIANAIVKENISILEIASHLSSLSEAIEEKATVAFEDYGLRISDFRIISIHTDDENPAVQQLRDALSERAKLDILGTSFTQSRSFEVLEQAAGNEGAAGNVMGAGIGMGMGVGMGIPMGGQMGNVAGNVDPTASATRTTTCDKCGAVIPGNVRFCPSCGDSVDRCLHCGADNDASAMTCRSCHKALASSAPSATCGKCGVQNPGGAKFCSACGTLITASSPAACSNCNGPLSAGAVFCPGCGTKVSTEESEDS